jgi:hypothetical protein
MTIPATGIWKSGSGFPEVTVRAVKEFADAEGYFLAAVDIAGEPESLELDPDEWNIFIKANALSPA